MGEKKVVSRKVALGIGLLCIALLIIMGGIVANYTSALNDKDTQITKKANWHVAKSKCKPSEASVV